MDSSALCAAEPTFAIVIPSRDRPAQLRRCLEAISHLEAPGDDFEVIVVDDGSREPYEPMLASFSKVLKLRGLRCDGKGPACARNRGVKLSRAHFVALIDDDCVPAPDWLTRLGAVLRSQPDALAGGRVVNGIPENACSEASQVLISYLYDYYNVGTHQTRFFAGCNMAMSAELYRQCDGFDSRFTLAGGEDRDFCDRWIHAGRPLVYAADAVVHHSNDLTLRGFLRQHFTYGRGAWHFHRARRERGLDKVRVEPFSFLTGLLARPFRELSVRRPMIVSFLIGMSVVVNALGYFHERFHRPRSAQSALTEHAARLEKPGVAAGPR
jgi:GT2 family glycosyltransferase